MLSNEQRAELGRKAIEAAVNIEDYAGEGGEEASAVDAVANILHHVHANGGDLENITRVALNHAQAEIDEEAAVAS